MSFQFIKMFIAGFVSFFATGVDDTVAYAPLMRNRREKIIVSSGIVIATLLDLLIALFFASLISRLPYTNYIGGVGLALLGGWILWGKGLEPKPLVNLLTKHPERFRREKVVSPFKLFILGFTTFFLTGLDDTIAYSFLLVTPAAIAGISAGILAATFIDLILVFFIADRLKKVKHSREIGGAALIFLGVLVMLRML